MRGIGGWGWGVGVVEAHWDDVQQELVIQRCLGAQLDWDQSLMGSMTFFA